MKNFVPTFVFVFFLAAAGFAAAVDSVEEGPAAPTQVKGAPLVLELVKHDISPEIRSIDPLVGNDKQRRIFRHPEAPEDINGLPDGWQGTQGVRYSPHVMQKSQGRGAAMPTPDVNVEGLGAGMPGFQLPGVPPDTTGAVGRNYYIQWVNKSFSYFEKDGTLVALPGPDWRSGNTLWSGFGGRCQNSNDGDPITLYDQMADRWVLTQFGLSNAATGPHSQCVAVSVTDDPLGSWHRYEYVWPANRLNDYPKMSVWPDGYYLSVNEFDCPGWNSCVWDGAAVAVMEREQMLQGNPADTLFWDLGGSYGNLLPADLDGDTLPPENDPGMFFAVRGSLNDLLSIWHVFVDWDNPGASAFGIDGVNPNTTIDVSNYINTDAIAQPGTDEELDAMSPRLMFRAPYRNFGTHQSVVLSHTVNRPAAQRWYEIRDPADANPVLYQEGTYSPDGDGRWMGSIAMDRFGNIALGYSVSGDAVSPSIRVVGRNAGDPLGEMTMSEGEIQTGSGHQNPWGDRNRWGDYSTMSIDPSDDCTFWYTQEYVASVGAFVWRTRVAAFAFPECRAFGPSIFADGFESGDTSAWD